MQRSCGRTLLFARPGITNSEKAAANLPLQESQEEAADKEPGVMQKRQKPGAAGVKKSTADRTAGKPRRTLLRSRDLSAQTQICSFFCFPRRSNFLWKSYFE